MAYGAATDSGNSSSAAFLPTGIPVGAYMESVFLFPETRVPTVPTGWSFSFFSDGIAGAWEVQSRWRINDGTAWSWGLDSSADWAHLVAWTDTSLSGDQRSGSCHETLSFGNNGAANSPNPSVDGLVLAVAYDDQATSPTGFGDFSQLDFVDVGGQASLSAYVFDGAAGADPTLISSPALLRSHWRDIARSPRVRWWAGVGGWV